jgi:hypothetical protein
MNDDDTMRDPNLVTPERREMTNDILDAARSLYAAMDLGLREPAVRQTGLLVEAATALKASLDAEQERIDRMAGV